MDSGLSATRGFVHSLWSMPQRNMYMKVGISDPDPDDLSPGTAKSKIWDGKALLADYSRRRPA